MATTAGRAGADFTIATSKIIAERANYRCVVPNCKVPTSGPGAKSREVARTGTASHIYSAAGTGPRGRGGLTPKQLSDPDNGVWTCATHGRLIDTNAGGAYPASLLKGWKRLQEAQIRKERDGVATNVGWIDRFTIQNSFLFKNDAELILGQYSILQGGSHGKTAICDWILANLGGFMPSRWRGITSSILTSIICYLPERKEIEATFQGGVEKLVVNGVAIAEMPKAVAVVYLHESARRLLQEHGGEVDQRIAAALDIDRTLLRKLMPDVQRYGTSWGRNLAFYDEPKYLGEDKHGIEQFSQVETEVVLRRGGKNGVVFEALSGSETVRVLIDFACALARERARHGPTILLLDGSDWPFDRTNMDSCGTYLAEQPYQIILTARGGWKPESLEDWEAWNRYKVLDGAGGTRIKNAEW